MIFQHIGHSEFLIETESGQRIVTDPYGEGCGYPIRKLKADTALVSHGHHDHNAVENLEGLQTIVDKPGLFTPAAGVRITALEAFHDEANGSKRGKTLLFLIETEGLRIVHLGDLGYTTGCINDTRRRVLYHRRENSAGDHCKAASRCHIPHAL